MRKKAVYVSYFYLKGDKTGLGKLVVQDAQIKTPDDIGEISARIIRDFEFDNIVILSFKTLKWREKR